MQPEDSNNYARPQLKILLCEDSRVNQMYVAKILQEFELDIASNGQMALDRMMELAQADHSAEDYDLILMDISMPVMDGLEATRRIRSLADRFLNLPILALTAHDMAFKHQEILDAGLNACLAKPIDRELLLNTIHGFTGDSNPAR